MRRSPIVMTLLALTALDGGCGSPTTIGTDAPSADGPIICDTCLGLRTTVGFNETPLDAQLGDMNGDGVADLVYATGTAIMFNIRSPFDGEVAHPAIKGPTTSARQFTLLDIDLDGRLDVVAMEVGVDNRGVEVTRFLVFLAAEVGVFEEARVFTHEGAPAGTLLRDYIASSQRVGEVILGSSKDVRAYTRAMEPGAALPLLGLSNVQKIAIRKTNFVSPDHVFFAVQGDMVLAHVLGDGLPIVSAVRSFDTEVLGLALGAGFPSPEGDRFGIQAITKDGFESLVLDIARGGVSSHSSTAHGHDLRLLADTVPPSKHHVAVTPDRLLVLEVREGRELLPTRGTQFDPSAITTVHAYSTGDRPEDRVLSATVVTESTRNRVTIFAFGR